jgi:hypothetical protein
MCWFVKRIQSLQHHDRLLHEYTEDVEDDLRVTKYNLPADVIDSRLKKLTKLKTKEKEHGWNTTLDMYTKGACPKVRVFFSCFCKCLGGYHFTVLLTCLSQCLQIEDLPEAELGPNFRIPSEEFEEEEDAMEVEPEASLRKHKAPSALASSKARPQGGTSTAALEKKKREALMISSDDEEGGALHKIPVTKK